MDDRLLALGNRRQIFTVVKYTTYLLLFANVFFFLREELLALEHTYGSDFTLGQFGQVFAASIDTAAWVILLLLFELETYILDDEQIRGWVKRFLHTTRLICGATILWAFSGYYAELIAIYQVSAFGGVDVCSLGNDWSVLVDLDEYVPLGIENCGALNAEAFRFDGLQILSPADTLQAAQFLAWTDVINAATWILVVIVLEVEVRLQLRGNLTDGFVQTMRYVKSALYAILLAAAIYWGFKGDFIDFWDASLWLFAFVFIELNVFDWHQESQEVVAA